MQNLSLIYQIAIVLSLFITGAIYQTSNVIYRVGLLIMLELVGAQLILLLGQNFQGLTYIIVYIGALAILFLFVIMMQRPSNIPSQPPYLSLLQLLTFFLFSPIQPSIIDYLNNSSDVYSHLQNLNSIITPNWVTSFQELTDIESMGYMIYVSYPQLLIYVGISLLLVLIGIIVVLGYKG